MRILEAFGEPISYGGQESFVMNVLDNMDRTGIEIDLLSPYYCDNPSVADRVRQYGGEVYALGCGFRPGGLRNNAAKSIKRFLKNHKYDVIHIHSGSNSMLAMLSRLASKAGIPFIIVHSHCTGKRGWKHFVSKLMTSGDLKRYPSLYCACSKEAGEWRFPADVCKSELKIINNGIDTEKFRYDETAREKMRSELCISSDTVLVACVGRLTYQKNQSFLLDVMKEVKERGGMKHKLIFIGEGEDHHALEKKASELGIRDDIIFTGAVPNVHDYLQAADVVAMPSRYEGLAIAVIEAQAAGLEIIASDKIPESAAVTEGVTFFATDDTATWAQALMAKHTRHPEQADQTAQHGYGIKETADIVRNLYMT